MKPLEPHETLIAGSWIFAGGTMRGDENSARIDYLVSNVLRKIATDASGWDVLYQDPADGRYWERTYPQSGMQGGGPPMLKCISENEAKAKYGDALR